MLLEMSPAPWEVQLEHAWNSEDSSVNILVKEDDPLTLYRHPVAQSTDGIRGKVGHTAGLHVWEIRWPKADRGTQAVVGVGTSEAPLHGEGYKSLIGCDTDQSWGWDLKKNKLYHNTKNKAFGRPYPPYFKCAEDFTAPDVFQVVLNMDEGTLGFTAHGKYLGEAFTGLKGHKLYPILSTVWGKVEIKMKYVGGISLQPLPLMDLSRFVIRQCVGEERSHRMNELGVPKALGSFVAFK
jgi:SPRY domain-containing SOCS box protein 1/4